MTLHEIAYAKSRLRDLEGALRSYRLAVRAKARAPLRERRRFEYATTLHELGHTLRLLGKKRTALATLRAAVAEDRRARVRDWNARARTLRSIAALQWGAEDWPAARRAYSRTRRAMEKSPPRRRDWLEYAAVLDKLMWIHVEMRNIPKAVEIGALARSAFLRIPARSRDATWRASYREALLELAFALTHVGKVSAAESVRRDANRTRSPNAARRRVVVRRSSRSE